MNTPVHHHAIVIASVRRSADDINVEELDRFLRDAVRCIGMQILISPSVAYGPYGYTGLVGISTSHIAFHFFESEQLLQFDAYSCARFNLPKLMHFLEAYWDIEHADVLFMNRKHGAPPNILKYETNLGVPGRLVRMDLMESGPRFANS